MSHPSHCFDHVQVVFIHSPSIYKNHALHYIVLRIFSCARSFFLVFVCMIDSLARFEKVTNCRSHRSHLGLLQYYRKVTGVLFSRNINAHDEMVAFGDTRYVSRGEYPHCSLQARNQEGNINIRGLDRRARGNASARGAVFQDFIHPHEGHQCGTEQ